VKKNVRYLNTDGVDNTNSIRCCSSIPLSILVASWLCGTKLLCDLVPSNKNIPVTVIFPHACFGFQYLWLDMHEQKTLLLYKAWWRSHWYSSSIFSQVKPSQNLISMLQYPSIVATYIFSNFNIAIYQTISTCCANLWTAGKLVFSLQTTKDHPAFTNLLLMLIYTLTIWHIHLRKHMSTTEVCDGTQPITGDKLNSWSQVTNWIPGGHRHERGLSLPYFCPIRHSFTLRDEASKI
jgi:hypothetical protein